MDKRPTDLTQSQLFIDDRWVEESYRSTRSWYNADIFPEPVLRPKKPWEGTNIWLYGGVIKIGDRFRMYYSAQNQFMPAGMPMCVAESDDGLQWHRPIVGEVECMGDKNNYISISAGFQEGRLVTNPMV